MTGSSRIDQLEAEVAELKSQSAAAGAPSLGDEAPSGSSAGGEIGTDTPQHYHSRE
jgi:hypothetical protein